MKEGDDLTIQLLVLILLLLLILLGTSRAPRRVARAAEPRQRRALASTPTQAPASGHYEGPSTATYRNWFIVSAGIPLGVLAAVLKMVVVIGHLLATGGMETSSTDTIARNVGILMLAASILGPLSVWGQVRTAAHSVRWDAEGVTVISYGGRADRFAWEDLNSLHTWHPRLGLHSASGRPPSRAPCLLGRRDQTASGLAEEPRTRQLWAQRCGVPAATWLGG